MKTSKFALALGAAMLVGLPAAASAGDKESVELVDKNHEKADDPATIVCKRMPPPAGTRMMGKKVCRTNAAWRLEKESAGIAARENQDRGAVANRGS